MKFQAKIGIPATGFKPEALSEGILSGKRFALIHFYFFMVSGIVAGNVAH